MVGCKELCAADTGSIGKHSDAADGHFLPHRYAAWRFWPGSGLLFLASR